MIGRVRSGAVALGCVLLAACAGTPSPPRYPEASWSAGTDGVATPTVSDAGPTGAGASCTPGEGFSSAAAANSWMGGLDGLPGWRSADVGVSVPLSDGRVVWVFGDTGRAAGFTPRMVSSSALVTDGNCTSQWTSAADGPFLPNEPGSVCWPSSMVARKVGSADQVLVACSRVRRGSGHGLFDFTYLGMSLVRFEVSPGKVSTVPEGHTVTPDRDDSRQVNWGAAMVLDQGWVYFYGSQQGESQFGARRLAVARTTWEAASDQRTWTFWNGRTWSSSANDAQPVIDRNPGVSQALTVHQVNGKFVAVSKKGGDLSDTVAVWSAPSPTGPWTVVHEHRMPYDAGNSVVTYQPLAHPQIRLASGQLLVSVSRNPKDLQRVLAEPNLGRPTFIEMPTP